jgi:hypothetical protein
MHQGKSHGGPEANGSDGSSFYTSLTVFSIPTPATGAREAIGSKLPAAFERGSGCRYILLVTVVFLSRSNTRERRRELRETEGVCRGGWDARGQAAWVPSA